MRRYQRLLVPICAALVVAVAGATAAWGAGHSKKKSSLPVKAIESAMQVKGTMVQGVLSLGFDRTDITNVKIGHVPIEPSFEINGEFDFQPLGRGRAFMNGDMPVRPSEINRVVSTIVDNGLTFQAEHQHMYDFSPMVWFIHIRAKGNAVSIARKLHKVLKATSIPLPQKPSDSKTPLNQKRLEKILHGYDTEVGDGGVVTVYIARKGTVRIDGVKVKPATNIATNVGFEPLNKSGSQVAVVPDFAMVSREINSLMRTMRGLGWDIGCLYNQETGEQPQLYFSHQFKTGNPYTLAAEVRRGLNHTHSH